MNKPASDGAASSGSETQSMADDVVAARRKIFTQKAAEKSIAKTLGEDDGPASQPAIDMRMDVGSMITGLIGKLGEAQNFTMQMVQASNDSVQKATAEALNARVDTLKEQLEDARAGNSTETLLATIQQVRTLERDLLDESRPAGRSEVGGMPAAIYVEVEKMKIDHAAFMAKWEAEREESKRKWEADQTQRHEEFLWAMRKFDIEREDKKEERKEARELEEKKMRMEAGDRGKKQETISDLLAAATRAVDNAMAGGGGNEPMPAMSASAVQTNGAASPTMEEFECQECHHKELIPVNTASYICPNCHTKYNDQPPA